MRWYWWSAIGLGILLALWVGAFATVFELGPKGFVFYWSTEDPPMACPKLRTQTYVVSANYIDRGGLTFPIWRPLMFVWARCWGAKRLAIEDYRHVDPHHLLPADEVDSLIHGRD